MNTLLAKGLILLGGFLKEYYHTDYFTRVWLVPWDELHRVISIPVKPALSPEDMFDTSIIWNESEQVLLNEFVYKDSMTEGVLIRAGYSQHSRTLIVSVKGVKDEN